MQTQRRRPSEVPGEDGCQDWTSVSTSQEASGFTRRDRKRFSFRASGRDGLCQNLGFRLLLSRAGDNTFQVFQLPCYGDVSDCFWNFIYLCSLYHSCHPCSSCHPFIHLFSAYYSLGPGNINTKRVSQCLWGFYSLGVMGEGGGSLTALTGKSRHLQIPGLTCALQMAELLSLDTILIFRMDKSLSLGCSVGCGMLSNIPSLCPLEANSMPNPSPLLQSKLYPDIAKYISPVEAKLYLVENHRCMCMAFLCLEHYCPWAVGKLFLSFWILKHGCFSVIPKAVCANLA